MVFGVLSDGSKQFTISLGGQIFLIRMHMGLHPTGENDSSDCDPPEPDNRLGRESVGTILESIGPSHL